MYSPLLRAATLSILTVALAAGCAAPASKVRVDAIEGQLPACRTFAWNSSAGVASFTDQRVHTAVMHVLEKKGYTEVPEKADCRVAYQLSAARDAAPPKPHVGVGVGGGPGGVGVGGGIGVSLPVGHNGGSKGTFAIDIIDASKNAQVWSGSVDGSFGAELSDKDAQAIAEKVLAAYPDRAK